MFERKAPKKSAVKVEIEKVEVEQTPEKDSKGLVVKSRVRAGCIRVHGDPWGG